MFALVQTGAQKDDEKWFLQYWTVAAQYRKLCVLVQRIKKKKWRPSQWGFCCLSWRQQKHKKHWLTNTWPLCASNTSELHLIQCQQMPPLSSSVAPFLSVRKIFSCFYKGYCFLSRHLGEQILACIARVLSLHSLRGWKGPEHFSQLAVLKTVRSFSSERRKSQITSFIPLFKKRMKSE